jgi:tRNA-Thr(GGU) m(6)t(6)A37 methyltransferase TsaA
MIKIKSAGSVQAAPVPDAGGVSVRWLWADSDGAPNFALRLFEVEPGASTPYHAHPYEHEVYVLSGQARLRGEDQEHRLEPGDTVLVPPNELHQFHNPGSVLLRFLCAVPWPRQSAAVMAQVSLYPLRQPTLSPAIDEAVRIFRTRGLDVTPGAMSTLLSGDGAQVFKALNIAFDRAASPGHAVMVVTVSNACPVPDRPPEEEISFRAIGHVENPFTDPADPETLRGSDSRIVLDANLTDGLIGLKPGDRLIVAFAFHRSEGYDLLQHPRGDPSRDPQGVFSLRSPRRPNPLGITEVELVSIEGNVLIVRGLDAIRGTPVLDLKPA